MRSFVDCAAGVVVAVALLVQLGLISLRVSDG